MNSWVSIGINPKFGFVGNPHVNSESQIPSNMYTTTRNKCLYKYISAYKSRTENKQGYIVIIPSK